MRYIDVMQAVRSCEPGTWVGIHTLYRLLKERLDQPAVNISHQQMPTIEAHLDFIKSDPYRLWLYVEHPDEGAVGSISATRQNELGIQVFKKQQNKGYGSQMLQRVLTSYSPLPAVPGYRRQMWLANINPDNVRSVEFFARHGFDKVQETYGYTVD